MDWITLVGYGAAICTTAAYLPQAIKTIKTRNTADLSLPMYIILLTGILCWLIYGIANKDFPIIAANVITIVFATIILIYKLRYK